MGSMPDNLANPFVNERSVVSMPKRVDRRVRRTTDAVKSALLDLILERGYEGFSVQELLDRANVGRSTFYAHFRDKEDVLRQSLDDLHGAILTHWKSTSRQPGTAEFVLPFLIHVESARPLWKAMATGDALEIVVRRFRIIFADLFRQDLGPDATHNSALEAKVQLQVGALIGLMTWWLEVDPKLTAAEVDQLFRNSLKRNSA